MGGVSRGGQVGDTVSLVSTNDGDKGRERWGVFHVAARLGIQ